MMMTDNSKLVFFWLFCCCLPMQVPQADAETAPGDRWLKKARQQELEPFEIEAYQQLSRIHGCEFHQQEHRGSIHILSFSKDSDEPMDILYAMGLKVLPILSEAINDSSPSQTVTTDRTLEKRVWKVNELVARLIRHIADREFVIGEWGDGVSIIDIGQHPELQAQFQQLILTWYEQNRDKTFQERKIAELQSNLRNRLDALMWPGKQRSTNAAPFIATRIDTILSDTTVSSSTHAELAEASLALGRIGDVSTLPAVTKACGHLSYWIDMSYRPIEQGRSGTGSNQRVDLFKAYHGMALLGRKPEALAELERLLQEYGKEMEGHAREEYEALLRVAKRWEENTLNEELKATR